MTGPPGSHRFTKPYRGLAASPLGAPRSALAKPVRHRIRCRDRVTRFYPSPCQFQPRACILNGPPRQVGRRASFLPGLPGTRRGGDYIAAPADRGKTLLAVTNAIVGMHREFYGRGATKGRTVMQENY